MNVGNNVEKNWRKWVTLSQSFPSLEIVSNIVINLSSDTTSLDKVFNQITPFGIEAFHP
jgi:hypothetical protein